MGAPDMRLMRSTLTAQLEEALRADIIQGILEPGRRLRSAEMAQHYGVSATPLREALQSLAAQNLVTIDPRFGATVAETSVEELHDIFWLRDILEGIAVQRSIELGDKAWEQSVTRARDAFRAVGQLADLGGRAEVSRWVAAHAAFHEALLAAADSPWLIRFVRVLSGHAERYWMQVTASRARTGLQEHEAQYEAVMRRDVTAARELLRAHRARTRGLLEEAMHVPAVASAE